MSWAHNTYTFTATATSHELVIVASAATGGASVLVDDITLVEDAWTEAGTTTSALQDSVTDSVVRSQSGRIMQNVLTDGAAVETSTYSFDAAGRLVQANIPRHVLSYSFADTTTCAATDASGAGRNGNRTGFSDVKDGGTPTTVAYCYDGADRHMTTRLTQGTSSQSDDTVITYLRDATGRIVSRTVQGPAASGVTPAAVTIRYTFAGSSLHGVLTGVGVLVERTVSLPGGVSVSIPAAGTGGGGGSGSGSGGAGEGAVAGGGGAVQSWSYPNLHGDNILLTDQAGARQGARASFDPFGQPIDPVTGDIGTSQPPSASGRRRWRRTIASRPS